MTDEDQRALAVRTVAAVFMPIATIAVMLRCYVRGWIVKGFGWDDGAMVFAALFYIMFSACMIGGTIYGTGRKFIHLEAHQRVTAMKYWWLCEVAYCFSSIGCKISISVFLMRITVKRSHIWTLYTVMILTVIAGLVFFFLMLLQCKPLSYFWTRTALDPLIEGHCISINIIIIMTYIYSAFAALCDFTVGILPIFLVSKLHMKREAKMAVIGILSMACIASSAVIIRFPFVKTFGDEDFLYATYQIAIWSNIEAGLGITAGSLATLRPLLRKWLGSRNDSRYPSGFPNSGHLGANSNSRPMPLGSIDGSRQKGLRPDKLAVMVTNIESQRDTELTWGGSTSPSSSEERLTTEPPMPASRKMDIGIHQTFEVTQTTDAYDAEGSHHRMAREHV
ncbi:putative integral membrane protein [Penicillium brasilianum]|uniref:Putative integral membrane protein n=1 Tax=Penicillium brasilianum TaxID=104259 RepID=A0A1S9RJV9_PENBI|nr:putative integral membrane protein [Penicillium brasilianum]